MADAPYIPLSYMKAIQAYDPTIGFSTRLSALYDLKFYHCEDFLDDKLKDDWRITVAWWCTLVPDESTLLYPVEKVIDLATKIAKELKKRGLTIPREYASSDQQKLFDILRDRGVDLPKVSEPGEEEDKNTDFTGAMSAQVISKAEKLDDSEGRTSPVEQPGVNCAVADELTKGNQNNAGMHKHIIPGHPGFEAKEHPISQLHTDVPTVGVKTALPTRHRPSLGQIHHPAAKKYMQEHADPAAHLDEVIKSIDARMASYDPDMRVAMFDGRKHLTTSQDDLSCWNCPRVDEIGTHLWCPLMGVVDPLQVCRFYDLPVFLIGVGDLKKSKEPWEMTRKEMKDTARAEETVRQQQKHQGIEPKKSWVGGLPVGAHAEIEQAGSLAIDSHSNMVRNALTEGKKVPSHVLAEYPQHMGLKKSKDYAALFDELLAWCKEHNIKVETVSEDELKDFEAINDEAAKKFGYDDMGAAAIKITDKKYGVPLSAEEKLQDLAHELTERKLMKDEDMSYWRAHLESLAAEHDIEKAPEELICSVGPQAKMEPVMVRRGGKVFASHRFKGLAQGKAKRGQTHTLSGQLIPKHWTHVILATRKNSPLQAVGKDAAGRTQYLYSSERTAKKAAGKWSRLKAFGKVVSVLDSAIEKRARRNDEGLILDIIKHTAFRIGSHADTKARVQAYGVSTLLAKHVKVNGDRVEFNFIGKEGVKNHKVIHDPQIADALSKRLARAKTPNDSLFGVNDDHVRRAFHELPKANSFLVKDYRTFIGTQAAFAAVKKMSVPQNAIQFIKARREVAGKVAQVLGNTPSIAMKAYIAPEVFSYWLGQLAIKGIELKKEASDGGNDGGYCVDAGNADTNRVGGYQFGSGAIMKAEDNEIGQPESLEELFETVQYDEDGDYDWENDDPDAQDDDD